MNVAHTYRYIRSIARNDDPQKRPAATDACMIRTMQELAEYHFGNSGESSKRRREHERFIRIPPWKNLI